MDYGCLFCRTGSENRVAEYINSRFDGAEAIAPKRLRRKTVQGETLEDSALLLPSYVFFRTDGELAIKDVRRISGVIKLLRYRDDDWKLIGSDLAYAQFFFEHPIITYSNATFIDGKIHFLDGILLGHDEDVLRVNRRTQTVEVKMDIVNGGIWVGYIQND